MEKDKVKELSKDPFKIKNKMEKEKEVIQKIIDSTTKKEIISELGDALIVEFEKLLLKTKDAVQSWVRANVFDELNYPEIALLFKAKALELGYIVENVNIESETHENYSIAINAEFNTKEALELFEAEVNLVFEKDKIKSELKFKSVNSSINKDMNIIVPEDKTKEETNENMSSPDLYNKLIDKYKLSDVLSDQLLQVANDWDNGNISPEDKIEKINAIAAITGDTVENIKSLIGENYNPSSDEFRYYKIIIGGGKDIKYIKMLTDEPNDKESVINYAITNNLVKPEELHFLHGTEEIINTVEEVSKDEYDKTFIKENHKQQFEYHPQEEIIHKVDEDAPVVKKPKFNAVALRHMISDDAFLKFSYHNLSVGDEAQDLDLIFDTYIKGDEDMEKKLNNYEAYLIYKAQK